MNWLRSVLVAAVITGPPLSAATAAPQAGGQGEEPSLPHSQPAPPAPGSAGFVPGLQMRYQGVAPGRPDLPPGAPAQPGQPGGQEPAEGAKGPVQLTWPGFQVRDGKATVFLQLSGPAEYSVADRPGQVVVTLLSTVVTLRNNRRPILAEEFGTPVTRVTVLPRKEWVDVVIDVRGDVAHKERVAQENGFHMVLVEITPAVGAGAAPKAAPAPVAAKPKKGKGKGKDKDKDKKDTEVAAAPESKKPLGSVFDEESGGAFRSAQDLQTPPKLNGKGDDGSDLGPTAKGGLGTVCKKKRKITTESGKVRYECIESTASGKPGK